MLQNFRDHIQGWVSAIIIGIISLAFALWGIENYFGRGTTAKALVKVNGEKITQDQLQTAYDRLRQRQTLLTGHELPLSTEVQAALKKEILNQLIEKEVLGNAAIDNGFVVIPQTLNAVILQMPMFQVGGRFSPDRFQEILSRLLYTQEAFFAELTRTLLIDQQMVSITRSAFLLPNEVEQGIKLIAQKRDFSYLLIPATHFLSSTEITSAAIKDYYQLHQDDFQIPEKIQIEYLELNAAKLEKSFAINQQELSDYYNNNLALYSRNGQTIPFEKVKQQIEKTVRQQKLQQEFSNASDKLSESTYTNPGTLDEGAKALGLSIQTTDYFSREGEKQGIAANPKIINAAFSDEVLKQGNNSNVIQINDGDVIVLRVKAVKSATIIPLVQVQNKIIEILKRQGSEVKVKSIGEELLAQFKNNSESAERVAQKYGIAWKNEINVDRIQQGLNKEVLQEAFMIPKPDKMFGFGGITLTDGSYVLVKVIRVEEGQLSKTSPAYTQLKTQFEKNNSQLDYELFVNSLMKRAKIKHYN